MKGFSSDQTTPASAVVAKPLEAAQSVMGALKRAANSTGVDFGFLVRTAQRESALNPQAKARTSSAAGLFQFVEQTWLGTLKAHGAKYGYGGYADQIVKGAKGRYSVPNPQARQTILSLRYNADAAAHMAAEMTAGHAAYLKGRLGRDPTQTELYAAHFLGPGGAGDLAKTVSQNPRATAAGLFPQAAAANRSIFYNSGRAVSVTELMANLGKHTQGPVTLPVVQPDEIQSPDAPQPTLFAVQMKRIESERALLQLAFGTSDPSGTLFSAQLLSGFGPEKDEAAEPVVPAYQKPKIDWG
jgi:hypothetical protein